MLKKLTTLIIDPDLNARGRLREALGSVALKTEVTLCRTIVDGISTVQSKEPFDVIFITSATDPAKVHEFIEHTLTLSVTKGTVFIMTLKSDEQDSAYVAPLLLRGFNGFVCEPYSVDNLLATINNARQAKAAGIEKPHTKKVLLEFLIGDAIRHLDRLAYQRAIDGESSGGYALRDLKDVSKQMNDIAHDVGDALGDILVKRFENIAVPKAIPSHLRAKKTAVSHPGAEIRDIIGRRGISAEHLASCLKISVDDTRHLLDGVLPVSEHIAQGLAHNLGNTSVYWLNIQKKYDRANKKNASAKGTSPEKMAAPSA